MRLSRCESVQLLAMSMFVLLSLFSPRSALAAMEDGGPATLVRDIDDDGPPLHAGACAWAACGPRGYAGSLPAQLTSRAGTLIFAADDRRHGYELWLSRGTPATTRRVTDLCPGPCGSDPVVVGWLADELFFYAYAPSFGRELWATDGTAEGTRLVRDLCPGACDGDRTPYAGAHPFEQSWWAPGPLGARFRGSLVFPVLQGNRRSVWVTGGQWWNTREVRLACPPTAGEEACRAIAFAAVRGAIYFAGADGALWRARDLSPKARRVVQPCPPAEPGGGGLTASLGVATTVRADGDGVFLVRECASTAQVFHVRPGETAGREVLAFTTPAGAGVARELTGGRLLLVERSLSTTSRLWVSDGTVAGSGVLRSLDGNLTPHGVHAGRLYFSQGSIASGDVLWVSDGTPAGTAPLLGVTVSSFVEGVGRHAAFFTTGEENGWRFHELWLSDGTPAGTGAVQRFDFRLLDDEAWSTPLLHAAADRLYLSVDAGDLGQELWSLPRAAANPYGCRPDGSRLCLDGGRFAVGAAVDQRRGPPLPARALHLPGLSPDGRAGLFALRAGRRPELVVKVLDGGDVNGHHWVLFGGLPDLVYDRVAYTLEVRDLRRGVSRTYRREADEPCGGADTAAFGAALPIPEVPILIPVSAPAPSSAPATGCPADALCLHDGRFTVRVELDGGGVATPVEWEWDAEIGWFHFFAADNPELLVRVVDGRKVDGAYWVVWGGATSLGYRLTVRDGWSGAERVYVHPAGDLCGGADPDAFPSGTAGGGNNPPPGA